ncbi:MAG: hypothetical protein JXD23_17770 [Spirochaetales bacterium]|nr:hypothetical protein [Spirochaetales bacterium]
MDGSLIFIFIIALGVAASSIGWGVMRWVRTKNLFQKVAVRLQLSFDRGGILTSPRVYGILNGAHVEVCRRRFSHGKSSTDTFGFTVAGLGIPRFLDIKPERFLSRLKRMAGAHDIEFNDGSFDDAALVEGGDPHAVRAALHPRARSLIAHLIEASYSKNFAIQGGTIETYRRTGQFEDEEDIIRVLANLIDLAKTLGRSGRTEELLRENYLAESNRKARVRYLESLAATLRAPLETDDEIVRDAFYSGDPHLMFQAACALGPAGNRHLPDILPDADRELALKIIGRLEERKIEAPVPELIKCSSGIRDWTVKAALARFLGGTGRPEVETWLHGEIAGGSSAPADYRRECVRALGLCGGKASLEVLHGLQGPPGRREIEAAMSAILARLGVAETGWLSSAGAEPGEGGLSRAETGEDEDMYGANGRE